MDELYSIIELSRKFGEDREMVQGGGGNTSVKIVDGKMYVKASGTTLRMADIDGFIVVDVNEVLDILEDKDISELEPRERDLIISERLQGLVQGDSNKRPSIETFLHALLGKYVVHLHPVYVNALTCMDRGEALAREIFEGRIEYLWIRYSSPGYPLGVALKEELKRYTACNGNKAPEVIFLQNHGIILSANDKDAIYSLNDKVLKDLKRFWGLIAQKGDVMVREADYINLLKKVLVSLNLYGGFLQGSKSPVINAVLKMENSRSLFTGGALFPDQIVYCGAYPLYIEGSDDYETVKSMLQEFVINTGHPPKVIIFHSSAVIYNGNSLHENKAIEETLEAHLKVLLLIAIKGKPVFLTREETKYIANWESEKYRKKLISGEC